MPPILQIQNLQCAHKVWPNISLQAGESAGYLVPKEEDALALLNVLTGITDPENGHVSWFGTNLQDLPEKKLLPILRRSLSLTPDGGLLANLSLVENILLPCITRQPKEHTNFEKELHALATMENGYFGHTLKTLSKLPHQITDLERCSAGLLRAVIARPEILIFCNIFNEIDHNQTSLLSTWVDQLHAHLPNTAYFFLLPETSLPSSFSTVQLLSHE